MGLFPYFLSDCLFLVRRNIPDFCILILYTVAFLNSFLLTELWCFLEFSMYNVSLTNRANFISSYLMTWMPFVSFSCLLALARTSWLHWIDVARVGVLTSSWSSRECFQLFTKECNVCSGLILYGLYHAELCSFLTQSIESLYRDGMFYFVICFFFIYWDNHVFYF